MSLGLPFSVKFARSGGLFFSRRGCVLAVFLAHFPEKGISNRTAHYFNYSNFYDSGVHNVTHLPGRGDGCGLESVPGSLGRPSFSHSIRGKVELWAGGGAAALAARLVSSATSTRLVSILTKCYRG